MKRIAYIISRAYDPGIIFAILILISLSNSDLNLSEKIIWIFILEFLSFILPVAVFIYLLRTKKISDVDITNRRERQALFLITACFWLIVWLLTLIFNLPDQISLISLVGFLIVASWGLISPYFKISAHLAGATGFVLFCYLILKIDWMIWFGPLFILIISWSRYVLRKHTIFQMLAAIILTSLIVLSAVNLIK